ncbi:MAG: VWA domain-containing protein [Gammaproteobacteria bacterium]|nr:VWA domain-containing protein [Gammaproteobacteria bacterium]NIN37197.1 VWA domain-containing protein [Gammaproteobacteria bacterium]NIO26055.1 VWA domain-containing protein [Gammaproteobacteria bacterium]NIO66668.1 VWA domain-containing protein [Gammaproteobacteria bacterium]NIP46344.1 VWA domain-containing protein [Gammaproteobacteria bacterium]
MLQLAWPWALAAVALPVIVAWLLPTASSGGEAALRVPFFLRVAAWSDEGGTRSRRWRVMVAACAWLLLVLAAARPQWVGEPVALRITGRDLMLAVDLSGSMKRRDMKVGEHWDSRLAVVKQVAGEFIERRDGDRIGLILFGTRAYLQAPLTFDRPTVRALLEEAVIGLAGEQTAIGDAIGLGVKRLRDRPAKNRVLILLTDGANTAGEVHPLDAARFAAKLGLTIYTIGVGADVAMMRRLYGTARVNPSADLDEPTLAAIARATGGRYFRARETPELVDIYRTLDELEPVIGDEERFRPKTELFQWPLALALLLGVALIAGDLRRALQFPSRAGHRVHG